VSTQRFARHRGFEAWRSHFDVLLHRPANLASRRPRSAAGICPFPRYRPTDLCGRRLRLYLACRRRANATRSPGRWKDLQLQVLAAASGNRPESIGQTNTSTGPTSPPTPSSAPPWCHKSQAVHRSLSALWHTVGLWSPFNVRCSGRSKGPLPAMAASSANKLLHYIGMILLRVSRNHACYRFLRGERLSTSTKIEPS